MILIRGCMLFEFSLDLIYKLKDGILKDGIFRYDV